MFFQFINVEESVHALAAASKNFSTRHPEDVERIQFFKDQAIKLFKASYTNVSDIHEITDGVLQVPIWKNVGVTFAAVGEPNPTRGEDWPVDFSVPGLKYVEVHFWSALPFVNG